MAGTPRQTTPLCSAKTCPGAENCTPTKVEILDNELITLTKLMTCETWDSTAETVLHLAKRGG
ncbi:MAG: hypothetical protein OXI87_21025 [Albidovulum sp.]|nr:hypothetical protein [Albidovulum sp.]MDE0307338.1 hypothetical protein [Albidovulum sp.]